jgi:chromate reductase
VPKGDVLLVSGSLRRGSYNTALLRAAAHALPSGVGHAWLDGIAALPPYSEDDDGEPLTRPACAPWSLRSSKPTPTFIPTPQASPTPTDQVRSRGCRRDVSAR